MTRLFYCLLLMILSFCGQTQILSNPSQIQRGASVFMNYCSGCHSLRYMRYERMVHDLNLVSSDKTMGSGPMIVSMPVADANQWFGLMPPDLSLIARERGAKWLYAYLNGFYADASRPFGANNKLVPQVAMPNVLKPFQISLVDKKAWDDTLHDVVAFLVYVSEPAAFARYDLGGMVIVFLGVLCFVFYRLKVRVWRRVAHATDLLL